jgi:hypothetical protein
MPRKKRTSELSSEASGRYVNKARTVLAFAPDLADSVLAGSMTPTNAEAARGQPPSSASGSGTKIGHGLPDARSGWRGSSSGAPFSSRTLSISRSTRAGES